MRLPGVALPDRLNLIQSPGDRLGPYEILSLIGAGGMGEVYKARDTRLDRIVALKVSKAEFTERFKQEANLVAQLNHRNICTLHDVGPNFLVMELVDGVPLIGPPPVEKAVEYAGQILNALDHAHSKAQLLHTGLNSGRFCLMPFLHPDALVSFSIAAASLDDLVSSHISEVLVNFEAAFSVDNAEFFPELNNNVCEIHA